LILFGLEGTQTAQTTNNPSIVPHSDIKKRISRAVSLATIPKGLTQWTSEEKFSKCILSEVTEVADSIRKASASFIINFSAMNRQLLNSL
jgi:hypothetical protein